MTELKLPEQFKGAWEHALIVTYGAAIPFFENGLWRQFGARCRNKIILADGQQFLESCQNFAWGGLVRHLNQQYVAEGIFSPYAAHAKLILLTNAKRGRLLVGSGNLGWQGYASGGELFTCYEYEINQDEPEMLNPFLAAWEFVQELLARGYVTGFSARRRLEHLYENTPWLYQKPVGHWQPVRHNLDTSFLEQIKTLIGAQPVQELWILSPFYDQGAIALTRLLETFAPDRATVLVQPRHTSVDPQALQRVLDRFPNCRVQACAPQDEATYLHAKLYLLKLHDQTVCLQGSPNLSQVAMLRSAAQGNIELANLLSGPPDAFDELFQKLRIEPEAVQLESLNLRYTSADQDTDGASQEWQLTGGELREDRLQLTFRGKLPDLKAASLMINDKAFALDMRQQEAGYLDIKLTPEMQERLQHPVPVAIRWGTESPQTSNPVFVCNRASLDAVLEVSGDEGDETLSRLGELDLDDEELERLLAELDAALVIDRRSVWQLAGKAIPSTSNDDTDDALQLSYADIDYEMLRQHPKITQYTGRGTGERYLRSRLQIILTSITDHFQGLLNVSEQKQLVTQLVESQAETEEEREQEAEEQQRRRWSAAQRVQRILKNFVQRYLRGLQSPDFQTLAGFEVIGQNYIIFSHLLRRLLSKGWVDDEFIIKSFLEIWAFFWGDDSQPGYFRRLNETQQSEMLHWLREHHTDAEMIAALSYFAGLTEMGRRDSDVETKRNLRFGLRDFLRDMVRHPPFEMTATTLEEAWRIMANLVPYEFPLPSQIVEELTRLTQFETEYSFLRRVEEKYDYPSHCCTFKEVTILRQDIRQEVTVDCLVIRATEALDSEEKAKAILQDWMRFQDLDYYRIAAPDKNGSAKMLLYEVLDSTGVYWARDRNEDPVDFGPVPLKPLDWEDKLLQLETLAAQIDTELVLTPSKATVLSD